MAKDRARTDRNKSAEDNSIESRIHRNYDGLPPSERRIAEIILKLSGAIAAYSATEIAEQAGGSKAAVSRLMKRIGFANYEQARRASRDAQSKGSPLELLSRSPDKRQFSELVQAHVEQDHDNIATTMQGLSPTVMRDVVTGIWRARRVFLFGYRNSYHLAGFARWQFLQARRDVHLLPATGETLAEYLIDIGPRDLFVAIGFRRRVPEVARALETVATSGAKVLYITELGSPAQPVATWEIPVAIRGRDPFDRYAGAISLLHFLGVALISRSGQDGRERLELVEQLHETLHDFG